jgi:NitT/TauT family transport system substrate-binding protein
VDGLLEEAGMETTDVDKTSVVKIPVRMEMLFNNKIDAISVPDPLATFAEFKGAKIVGDDTKGRNLSQVVITMRENVLQEKREGVKGFYRAYAKAAEDINTAPQDFKDMLVENINIPEPIIEDYQLNRYSKPELPTEENINDILQWMNKKELLKNDLTYDDIVEKGLY